MTDDRLYERVAQILEQARGQVARTVNTAMVQAYWQVGCEIVEVEQAGEQRAGYGEGVIKRLSARLKRSFGKGFSVQNLGYMRQFYLAFPNGSTLPGIRQALPEESGQGAIRQAAPGRSRTEGAQRVRPARSAAGKVRQAPSDEATLAQMFPPALGWTHYVMLMRVANPTARAFYEIEAAREAWSTRQLERQIGALLFDRLAKHRNPDEVRALARRGQEVATPGDVLKDPFVLEFLDLGEHPALRERDVEQAIIERLEAFLLELGKGFCFGIDEEWDAPADGPPGAARAGSAVEQAQAIVDRIAGWALCVEFVHDLRRLPNDERLAPLKSLPRPAVLACQKLASHQRTRHAALYVAIADDYEAKQLATEVNQATAADLGKIDTFRFEDRTVLGAALDALGSGRFADAEDHAMARTAADSFWPQVVRGRQVAWNLVKLAAQLGRAIDLTRVMGGARSFAAAVEWYVATGAEVDAAHRQLEQARHQLAHFEIEEAAVLRERLDELRRLYRDWADRLAHGFHQVCRAEGFLPAAALQQRTLFDEQEATRLLGGPRQFRNFSLHLDDYRKGAPFPVRVDVSSGTKCYVRGDR